MSHPLCHLIHVHLLSLRRHKRLDTRQLLLNLLNTTRLNRLLHVVTFYGHGDILQYVGISGIVCFFFYLSDIPKQYGTSNLINSMKSSLESLKHSFLGKSSKTKYPEK